MVKFKKYIVTIELELGHNKKGVEDFVRKSLNENCPKELIGKIKVKVR